MTDERDHERARAERLAARDFVNSLPVRLDTSADLEQAIALTIDHRAQVRREALEEAAGVIDKTNVELDASQWQSKLTCHLLVEAIRERARG